MDIKTLENLLSNRFNPNIFFTFIREFTKNLRQNNEELNSIDDDFYSVEPVSSFQDTNGLNLHVVIIHTKKPSKIEKARIEQREIIRKYINQNLYTMPNGILAVFYNENHPLWRLSYTEIDWERSGKLKTPPRRYSYLIGEGEPIHTPAKQLSNLIKNPPHTIDEIKEAFSVEKLTDEFFKHYRNLYLNLKERVEKEPANIPLIENLKQNGYSVDDFAKKLLGQLVFLYFLQKKGWLGVPENKPYGEGDKKFLRNLFEQAKRNNRNFYNDYLLLLFYETLNNPRNNQMISDWSGYFNCKIPFLNGGLFEPIYDYKDILVHINNDIFSNESKDGILDIFDTYNFTVKEDEPLEKEVAVDPEMLGKVFENLIAENERKGQGAFYTPREIVHYMSQRSIIYYLSNKLNLPLEDVRQIFTKENFDELPENIKENAKTIDNELKNIKIVDPACGSGAFLVGVLHEIVKARSLFNENSNIYKLKKEAIENSIYGVDIDIGATEIAKLRLWLSLIVDEENPYKIDPLPNLEYKIMCGNSLLEELVIGDEVIPLSVESEYKKDITSQIEILEKDLVEKREILFELIKSKGRNNKEVKELEKEIIKIEKKIKSFKDKPQQKVNGTLIGLVELNQAFEEIKNLQHKFFNEHNPEKKKRLKEKIDEKLKDFVSKKIEEEEYKLWNRISYINNKYKSRKMPKSEENGISKYISILKELESYKKKLNFRG
ncbi:DNA methyltransferase, partial [Persephonella sp.]